MKRALLLAISTVAVLFALTAPAAASHVRCGDTITESTTLDSDVLCPDDFGGTAVWVAADDVVFNLAGHAVRSSVGGHGIAHQVPLRGVDIRNGTVEGFDVGVGLWGIDHAVRRLHIKARGYGIVTDVGGVSSGTAGCERRFSGSYCIERNQVETGLDGVGIALGTTDDAHIWGNTVRGPASVGIAVAGDRTRTVLNKVETCWTETRPGSWDSPSSAPQGVGIQVWNYMTRAVVALNTVTPCSADTLGIEVVARPAQPAPWDCQVGCGQGRGAEVRRNVVQGASTFTGRYGHGLFVSDPAAIVAGNTTNDNAGSGIVVASEGYASELTAFGPNDTLIINNSTNRNRLHGVYAPYAHDGGGNTAAGNGDANCVGVACEQS
jgi:hypothetical protein